MYSMVDGEDDVQTQSTPSRQVNRGARARSEASETIPAERQDHAKGSERIPTISPDDEVLELDDTCRKTQKMSASHFRSMLGPTAMLAHLPPIPAAPRVDTPSPPIQHEEVASTGLMAEALEQLKGGRFRLESDSDELDEARPGRSQPNTLPISNKRLAEITATAETRPAVAMSPLVRPAVGHLPQIPDDRRPMQRMQRIARIESEASVPRHPDRWIMFSTCVLIIAMFATVAMLVTR